MKVNFISINNNQSVPPQNKNVNFKYNSILKDLFRAGKLPTVKYGLYGAKLTQKNVSLEHMRAHSKGGKNSLFNYALADKFMNSIRGNSDIRDFLDIDIAKKYFLQFKNILIQYKGQIFDGNLYIKGALNTLSKLGVDIDLKV